MSLLRISNYPYLYFYKTPSTLSFRQKIYQSGHSRGFASQIQEIKSNSGALWISNTYRSGRWMDLLRLWNKIIGKEEEFLHQVHEKIDKSFDRLQFPHIRQIIPCFKEGGCYITFASKEQAKEAHKELNGYAMIGDERKRVFIVNGTPFIEDLQRRLPTPKILITIASQGSEKIKLNQELLFKEFREYGRMEDIMVAANGESAHVLFSSIKNAIAARNCTHFKPIGDAKFYIQYEPYSRFGFIRETLSNLKLLIPLLGLAISLSLYLLVDPTRFTSVTQRITRGYKDEKFHPKTHKEAIKNRENVFIQLYKILHHAPRGDIILLTGPSGSGKSYIVKKILHNRTFCTLIDCSEINTISEFLEILGDEIGFSPSFNALNTSLVWLESLIPGLKKTALSPSTHTQIVSIMKTLNSVLYLLSARPTEEANFPVVAFDGFAEFVERISTQDKEKAKEIINLISDWVVRSSNYAHFVFIGQGLYAEQLLKQNKDIRKTKLVVLHVEDLDTDDSTQFIKNRLENQDTEKIEYIASTVGGRISDLESIISAIEAGISIEDAIEDMIKTSEYRLRSAFGGKMLASETGYKWNQVQLWKAVKLLVQKRNVEYDEILFKAFGGNNEALKALVDNGIFSVKETSKKIFITAFSNVYWIAMKRLTEFPEFNKRMEILTRKYDLEKEMVEMQKYEHELVSLNKATKGTNLSVSQRKDFLVEKILQINEKVVQMENELDMVIKG